jgi:phospho-N-acetylmuramoyl-pentapeptide-transferase
LFNYLANEYVEIFSYFNLFNYITFRTGAAVLTSLFFSLIFGDLIIKKLIKLQPKGQPIRHDGPKSHIIQKAGTPTMGGLLILSSMSVSIFLWANLSNNLIWICYFSSIVFGMIGFFDDYKKIKLNSNKGVKASVRITFQIFFSFIIIYLIQLSIPHNISNIIYFPFFKNLILDLGVFYYIVGLIVIIGSANAVNLTDGLDGLAIVPVMIVAMSFAIISYLSGNILFADYLKISYIPNSGELAVFCGAIIGSALGFLWFNAPPAKVFMGDTGSLALGSAIGSLAIIVKHEIVLAIIGGMFVLETLSVIIQVLSFKITGKRIFRMAPLHHHFEKKGWPESTIVIRFWIITIVLALIGLATLKIR